MKEHKSCVNMDFYRIFIHKDASLSKLAVIISSSRIHFLPPIYHILIKFKRNNELKCDPMITQ